MAHQWEPQQILCGEPLGLVNFDTAANFFLNQGSFRGESAFFFFPSIFPNSSNPLRYLYMILSRNLSDGLAAVRSCSYLSMEMLVLPRSY